MRDSSQKDKLHFKMQQLLLLWKNKKELNWNSIKDPPPGTAGWKVTHPASNPSLFVAIVLRPI